MNNRLQDGVWKTIGVFFIIFLLSGCSKENVLPEATKRDGIKSSAPHVVNQATPETIDGKIHAEAGHPKSIREEELATSTSMTGPTSQQPTDITILANKPTTLLQDLFFEYDQSTIRSEEIAVLQENAAWMLANPGKKIVVEGHADQRGTNEYNLVLGEKRAKAVQQYLIQLGVDSSRMSVNSFGEERPFCKTEDDTCLQENRRAHFRIK